MNSDPGILTKSNPIFVILAVFCCLHTHGFFDGLMNIAKGESLEYAIAMVNFLKKDIPSAKLIVAYDIFCIRRKFGIHYWNARLQSRGIVSSEIQSEKMLGIGFKGGEDCERFWSSLRDVVSQTTVMRNENREDVISLAWEAINDENLVSKKMMSRI